VKLYEFGDWVGDFLLLLCTAVVLAVVLIGLGLITR